MSMRKPTITFLSVIAFVCCSSTTNAKQLDIKPVHQATHVWCWLAVSEMTLRYFGVPAVNINYQCGMAGILFADTPCRYFCKACTFPAGSARNLVTALQRYPEFVRSRA